jgi:hypothetical protein
VSRSGRILAAGRVVFGAFLAPSALFGAAYAASRKASQLLYLMNILLNSKLRIQNSKLLRLSEGPSPPSLRGPRGRSNLNAPRLAILECGGLPPLSPQRLAAGLLIQCAAASRARQSGSKLPQSKAARFARGLRLPPSLLVLRINRINRASHLFSVSSVISVVRIFSPWPRTTRTTEGLKQ